MKLLRLMLIALFGLMTVALTLIFGAYLYVAPQLPSIEALRDVQLQVPLRIYTRDEKLMAEFGEKRRIPIAIDEVPDLMVKAFLAAEDDRFFEHPGVDYQGLLRAAFELARTGRKRQGGSTITMQVARNFFLTSEKTYLRKLTEIFLALKIERELSKQDILELYLNKIFMGQRAYGIGAAARAYYGVPLDQLSVAQMAMIAGLPKAPSRYNPIADPERAKIRRNYILGRMLELHYIDQTTYQAAIDELDTAQVHTTATEVQAPYVAEMVRAELVRRYGEEAYSQGLSVYTSIEAWHQQAANTALRSGLLEYDQRHGYRGPERRVSLPPGADATTLAALIRSETAIGNLQPALVVAVEDKSCRVLLRDAREVTLFWDGLSWARPYKSSNHRGEAPNKAADIVAVGDLVRVALEGDAWKLAQVPAVEGALVSLDPSDGAIKSLVGGFDFYRSKFNRVVQANRQPGSSFKPFIYSAALEKGFTAASVLNDAPVVFDDASLERAWRPENYSGRFYGPTRLREALVHSRNLVSIRLLQAIGVSYARDYVRRFGFRAESLPSDLSLSLGSGTLTPLEITRGYAVFANGGYLVEPYFIDRIVDVAGNVLYEAQPLRVCPECRTPNLQMTTLPSPGEPASTVTTTPLTTTAPANTPAPPALAEAVITPENAWLMTSMMQDVVQRGTAQRARELGRDDLAGKTGTTNDQRDAWFCGFAPTLVTSAWVGFDEVSPLGSGETGGRAALPIWMRYMQAALQGVPVQRSEPPAGMITVRIDADTGLLADSAQPDAVYETFRQGEVPTQVSRQQHGLSPQNGGIGLPEQLF